MSPLATFTFELSEPIELAATRRSLDEWLAGHAVARGARDDLVLAVEELCVNAIAASAARVTVHARVEEGHAWLEVADDGTGAASIDVPTAPPPVHVDGGRGLLIVSQLVDQVHTESDSAGTVVTVVKQLDVVPE